ncbi:MAG TPA: UDP-2,4-diacetamido-2,4,6-trideoxy-beta-L-altropyranose hydrolase [Oculatellaceae cyanobacterium]|jgi:UDP-2,4-diacetamido-2,4,6-trideoxy-beta-L-altropyranose hydrolase
MKIIIRTDANIAIGTGHVMRCLALAQAWQDAKGQAIFVMQMVVPVLADKLQSEGMQIVYLPVELNRNEDAEETVKIARQYEAQWVVVDGYQFDAEYQRAIKDAGLHLLFVDDYGHSDRYYADVVLNQNISADEGMYTKREEYTRLFLGTSYTLLRREFLQWRRWKRSHPSTATKILVTMGGSDPDNVTLKVIQGLQLLQIEKLEVLVVVGGSNPHYEKLQTACENASISICLKRNVTNMPELMAWADIAITATGSTTWELAFMGVPSILIVLADNQEAIAQTLNTMNIAVNLGWHTHFTFIDLVKRLSQLLPDLTARKAMSVSSQQLIDGEGSNRVLMPLKNQVLRLRAICEDDCHLLWEWANDPEVRKASFNSDFIPWKQHINWFTDKLNDPNYYIFIAIDQKNQLIGQVRFHIFNHQQAEVGISVAAAHRGYGYSSILIKTAVEKFYKHTKIPTIHAYIKQHNYASIKAFEKANFQKIDLANYRGNLSLHYQYTC